MIRPIVMLLTVMMILPIVGCTDLLQPSQTTIELVNPGRYPVQVTLYLGQNQLSTWAVLATLGEEIERTVAAGETITITRKCDELQAAVIDDADVMIGGVDIGPSNNSDAVLRDGTDFGCGDRIRFTFDYPDVVLPTTLDIEVSYPG